MSEDKKIEGKLIGKITHYFDNIKVAVIELDDKLKVGDKIRIIGGEDTDFSQEIDSMEVEHEKVKQGKKGDAVGLKVKEKVRDGYKVYLDK
ncbi:MAG: EF-Tu/IF-2/RF-3 family GTPase [Candidatus Nealsonbacteria bacterium]